MAHTIFGERAIGSLAHQDIKPSDIAVATQGKLQQSPDLNDISLLVRPKVVRIFDPEV